MRGEDDINTLLGDIVGVDQCHKVGRKSDSEADEGSQLPVMSLADKNVEELSQLLSPLHTETHEILDRKDIRYQISPQLARYEPSLVCQSQCLV